MGAGHTQAWFRLDESSGFLEKVTPWQRGRERNVGKGLEAKGKCDTCEDLRGQGSLVEGGAQGREWQETGYFSFFILFNMF